MRRLSGHSAQTGRVAQTTVLSGRTTFKAIVEEHQRRDAYYAVKTLKPRRDLEDEPGRKQALWDATQRLLQPYLAGQTQPGPAG